jgi:hypothetical protein
MELLEDDPNAKQVIKDIFGGSEVYVHGTKPLGAVSSNSKRSDTIEIIKRTESLLINPRSRKRLFDWITISLLKEPTSKVTSPTFYSEQSSLMAINIDRDLHMRSRQIVAELESSADNDTSKNYYGYVPSEFITVIYDDYKGSAVVYNFINTLIVDLVTPYLEDRNAIIQSMEDQSDEEKASTKTELNRNAGSKMQRLALVLEEFLDAARKWAPVGVYPTVTNPRQMGAPKDILGAGYPGAKSILQAIRRLYELTGYVAGDMHDANVMVRYGTKDIVIVDVGLFEKERSFSPDFPNPDTLTGTIAEKKKKKSRKRRKKRANKHHPKHKRSKKYFGNSFYDFGLVHSDSSGDGGGGDGGGGDGNRNEKGLDGKDCWKGYGLKKGEPTKKKGGETVDNCVPDNEVASGNRKKGKIDKDKMKCNTPRTTQSHKGKSHVVKACSNGKEKIIPFGEKGASTAGKPKKGESEKMKKKRKSFKARHGKNIKKGKMSAAYWADKVKWENVLNDAEELLIEADKLLGEEI